MNEISTLLLMALARIPKAPTFLLQLLLGNRMPVMSGNANVKIELYKAGQKLAPISTPARGGVIMTHYGVDDINITAPLLAPEWDMTEMSNFAAPGELTMLGPDGNIQTVTTSDRNDAWRALKLQEAVQMILRRREWMLAKQLTTGQIVLQGEGGYSATINIGWDNAVAVGMAWDDTGALPFIDIDTLQNEAISLGLPSPDTLVLSPTAASAFVNNASVQKELALNVGYIDPIFDSARLPGVAARRIGYIRAYDLMVYSYGGKYPDEATGVMTPFIPEGSGVLVPSANINNAYFGLGAIQDTRDNSWFSGEYYPREYARGDGHANFLQVNSRPVNCLTEAESWYFLSGLTTAY